MIARKLEKRAERSTSVFDLLHTHHRQTEAAVDRISNDANSLRYVVHTRQVKSQHWPYLQFDMKWRNNSELRGSFLKSVCKSFVYDTDAFNLSYLLHCYSICEYVH